MANPTGRSLLHDAAKAGNLEEVRRLAQLDPQLVRHRDALCRTALHCACEEGHVAVAACLLDHGASLDHRDKYEVTALYMACWKGHGPVVDLLLGRGADPTIATNSQWTPLMIASSQGHEEVVRRLLLHQHPRCSLVNHRDGRGKTALWLACRDSHAGVVRLLLEAGAEPALADDRGETPMEKAI